MLPILEVCAAHDGVVDAPVELLAVGGFFARGIFSLNST